jgi:hypothetical protein
MIKGGIVQDVSGLPAGYEFHVEDHDEGEESHPSWDADKECLVTICKEPLSGRKILQSALLSWG